MVASRTLLAGFLLVLCSATAAVAEEIDNPQFLAWSQFGVGSQVALESKMDGGMTMESTRTLKEKANDHVVIEVTTILKVDGKDQPSRPVPRTVQAKIEEAKAKELSHEKLEAAGKSYDCTVYAMEDSAPNYLGSNPKIWVSRDVPGGVVKVDMSTPKGIISQILKSVEIKK